MLSFQGITGLVNCSLIFGNVRTTICKTSRKQTLYYKHSTPASMSSSTNTAHLVHLGIQQFSQGFVHFHRGDIPKTIELVEKGIGTLLVAYKKEPSDKTVRVLLKKKIEEYMNWVTELKKKSAPNKSLSFPSNIRECAICKFCLDPEDHCHKIRGFLKSFNLSIYGSLMGVESNPPPTKKIGNTSEAKIEALPLDIQNYLLSMLDFSSLISIGQTNKHFYKIANDNSLWKSIFLKQFSTAVEGCWCSQLEWKERFKIALPWSLTQPPRVSGDSIVGLQQQKQNINEILVLPIKYPHLFAGLRQPWRTIMLYGFHGVGKSTLLAHSIHSSGIELSFFPVNMALLPHDNQEVFVRNLFKVAYHHAPAVIFLHNIDEIFGEYTDSKIVKRSKTELLASLDLRHPGVFVIMSTSKPWKLDSSHCKRIDRWIHFPLPTASERLELITTQLRCMAMSCNFSEEEKLKIVTKTEDFSQEEICEVVKAATKLVDRTDDYTLSFYDLERTLNTFQCRVLKEDKEKMEQVRKFREA